MDQAQQWLFSNTSIQPMACSTYTMACGSTMACSTAPAPEAGPVREAIRPGQPAQITCYLPHVVCIAGMSHIDQSGCYFTSTAMANHENRDIRLVPLGIVAHGLQVSLCWVWEYDVGEVRTAQCMVPSCAHMWMWTSPLAPAHWYRMLAAPGPRPSHSSSTCTRHSVSRCNTEGVHV